MKRKLIRWLGGLVLVLALIVLAGPWGVGLMAEGRYKNLWTNLAQQQDGVEARVTDYDRGWFSSRSTVALRITEPAAVAGLAELGWAEMDDDGGTATLRLSERIHHGPVPFTAPAPLTQRWKPGFAVVDSRLATNMPVDDDLPLSNTMHLSLTGRVTGQLSVPALSLSVGEQDLRLRVEDAIEAEYGFTRDMERFSFRGQGGALQLVDADGTGLAIESPWVDMSHRRGPAGLWLGGSELRVDKIRVLGPVGGAPTFTGLTWATHSGVSDGLMEQSHELEVESLQQGEFQAGPLNLDATFFNMKPEAITAIQEAAAEWQGPATAESDDPAQLLSLIREPLMRLAAEQPGLRVDRFSMQLPNGEVSAEGRIQLADMDRATLEQRLADGIYARLVNGEGTLRAARPIVRQVLALTLMGSLPAGEMDENTIALLDGQIDAAAAQDLLTVDGDMIETRFRLEEGALYLNDQQLVRF